MSEASESQAAPTTEATPNSAPQADGNTTLTAPEQSQATAAAETTAKPDETPVIPDKYEFTPPEGGSVDPAAVEAFSPIAKDAGLTQEQFAKVFAYGQQVMAQAGEANALQYAEMQKQWSGQLKTDGIVDQSGQLTAENKQLAFSAIDRFGGDDLKQALNMTGAGNHPAIVKAFLEIGKAMQGAGPLVSGKPLPSTPRGNDIDSIAARLYPSSQGS